jgi:hypothetical protein
LVTILVLVGLVQMDESYREIVDPAAIEEPDAGDVNVIS